jgi:hypothetical protein
MGIEDQAGKRAVSGSGRAVEVDGVKANERRGRRRCIAGVRRERVEKTGADEINRRILVVRREEKKTVSPAQFDIGFWPALVKSSLKTTPACAVLANAPTAAVARSAIT